MINLLTYLIFKSIYIYIKFSIELRENRNGIFFIEKCHIHHAKNADDMIKFFDDCKVNRKKRKTKMNEDSSRSHSIFTIIIESFQKNGTEKLTKRSKLNIVDLAGSERSYKTECYGEDLNEGTKINSSLSTLCSVFKALAEFKDHIPYRESKLTKILKESLGGNNKTLMISNISLNEINYDETYTTLNYTNEVKKIKNKPKINYSHINQDNKNEFKTMINVLQEENSDSVTYLGKKRKSNWEIEKFDFHLQKKINDKKKIIKCLILISISLFILFLFGSFFQYFFQETPTYFEVTKKNLETIINSLKFL